MLTPKGIREESLITSKFLVCKKKEYELFKQVSHYQKNTYLRVNIFINNLDILGNILALCLDIKAMLWLNIDDNSKYVSTKLDSSLKQGDFNGHGHF